MASRFLRPDLCRAYRPVRPKKNTTSGSNALFFAANKSDRDHSQQQSPTQEQSATAVTGPAFSQGYLHCFGNQAYSSARSLSSTVSAGGVGAMRATVDAHRVGGSPLLSPGLQACCRWRGAGGVVLCGRREQQAGRRYLSTRRGKAVRQTLKNKQIKAQQILLVLETASGGKETTLVSRQQALAAADTANLDLVQVSGDKDPVVCRLMDYKREEYRKYKQKKASTKRVQKKKEVRLRGMIADHDFERKMSDVKKYLERGDMVKVVLEANTSLLKRSGNCLNDLQEKFEAEMEEFEGVVLKPAGGGDGYTRREVDCIPKAVKATTPKPPRSSAGPQAAAGGQAGQTEKSKPRPPPASSLVDEEIVREILNGAGDCSSSGLEVSDEELSEESSSEESSSSDEEAAGVESGFTEEQQQGATPLQVAGTVVWDVELSGELAEAVDGDDSNDLEWERNEARKREDRRKRDEAKARVREADRFDKRSGPRSAKKKWKVADDDNDGGFGGAVEWAEEERGTRRSSGRASGGRGRGNGGGRGPGAASGRGQTQGGFSRRGVDGNPGGVARNGGAPQDGFGRPGRGGRVGGAGGGRGRGVPRQGGMTPPPARKTPYKWRTSIADGNGPTVTSEAASGRAAWSRVSSGIGDGRVDDAGGDIRGFRARFGGKTAAQQRQQQQAPSAVGSVGQSPVEASPAGGVGAARRERIIFAPRGGDSPPAVGEPGGWRSTTGKGRDGTEE